MNDDQRELYEKLTARRIDIENEIEGYEDQAEEAHNSYDDGKLSKEELKDTNDMAEYEIAQLVKELSDIERRLDDIPA